MKDEDEDNIIPNEDKSNEDTNDSNESIDEGFEDIVTSEGKHFYDNHEGENDTITKLQECTRTGFWIRFICNSRTCGSRD
jgi:topoisomerase-4 subunit A